MSFQEHYELVDHNYGKGAVKLLHVKKEGALHSIRELEVSTSLKLESVVDYISGDNRDIVATDSQKNIVYIMARNHGVTTPEGFGILLCQFFLNTYQHVLEATVNIEMYPWERIDAAGKYHNHAFVFSPKATRRAAVTQKRFGLPKVSASLTDLRILKTTQSAFVGFIRDNYTTLPEAGDRIFSTIVKAHWKYSTHLGVDFDRSWEQVKLSILEKFAGPADAGVPSPSVQNTLYLAEKTILDRVKEICSIEMIMPNKHYFDIDFKRFPEGVVRGSVNEGVYQPVDKPSGMIRATLARKDIRSKL